MNECECYCCEDDSDDGACSCGLVSFGASDDGDQCDPAFCDVCEALGCDG